MEITLSIAIIAVIISAVSAIFTYVNLNRDQPNLIAWSEVIYDLNADIENPPPCFYIRLVNTGKRPIVLSAIEKIARNGSWRNPVGEPDYSGALEKLVIDHKRRREALLYKHTAVILKEAEFLEFYYDCYDFEVETTQLMDDDLFQAYDMAVIDILDKRYQIKDIKKNIKVTNNFIAAQNNAKKHLGQNSINI